MPSQLIKKWGHRYIDFTNDFKKSIALVIRKLVTYLQQLNTMMKINYLDISLILLFHNPSNDYLTSVLQNHFSSLKLRNYLINFSVRL